MKQVDRRVALCLAGKWLALIINPTDLPKARLIILLEVGINNDLTVALFHTPSSKNYSNARCFLYTCVGQKKE